MSSPSAYSPENYPRPPVGVADNVYLDYLVRKHRRRLDKTRPSDLHNRRVDAWNIEYPRHHADVRLLAHAYRHYVNAASQGNLEGAPSMVVALWSGNHSRYEVSGLHQQSGPPLRTEEKKTADVSWRKSLTSIPARNGGEVYVPPIERHPQYQCGEKPALRPFFNDPAKAGPDNTIYTVAVNVDGQERAMCRNCQSWVVNAIGNCPGCSEMRVYDVVTEIKYSKDSPVQNANLGRRREEARPRNTGRRALNAQARDYHASSALGNPAGLAQANFDPDNARNMGTTPYVIDEPSTSHASVLAQRTPRYYSDNVQASTSYASVVAQGTPRYVLPGEAYAISSQGAPSVQPNDDQFNARNMYNNSREVSASQHPVQQPQGREYSFPQGQGLAHPNLGYYSQQGGSAYYPDAMGPGQYPLP